MLLSAVAANLIFFLLIARTESDPVREWNIFELIADLTEIAESVLPMTALLQDGFSIPPLCTPG